MQRCPIFGYVSENVYLDHLWVKTYVVIPVDWMVADMLAIMQGSLGRIRYILKDGLKYLPLYGYYFRQVMTARSSYVDF